MRGGKMSYKYFRNDMCEFFPCHDGVTNDSFNCLFCYCPLYHLATGCGGNFNYLETGIKDCSACSIVHNGTSAWDHVQKMIKNNTGDNHE